MTPIQALFALFQAPAADANVSNSDLVTGYGKTWDYLAAYALVVDAIEPSTYDLSIRQAASDEFVTACLVSCFVAICEGMAGKSKSSDYKTAEDVEADLSALAAKWAVLADRSVDVSVRAAVADIYRNVAKILQALEVTLPHIVTIDAPVVPASVLSYWLYDTDANEEAIINLNTDQPPLLYDGDVSVMNPA